MRPLQIWYNGREVKNMDQFSRTELLLGIDGVARLKRARVAVFGVGGVGGYVAEALIRSGVGAIDLFDNDTVSLTNLNRQIIALHSTIGRDKTEVMAERLKDINPDAVITARRMFYLPETADEVDLSAYDFIVDAVDTVAAKLELVKRATAGNIPIISAMGAGNKLDPSKLCITDISKTHTCRLAKVMRVELRRRGIEHLTVAYSTEQPIPAKAESEEQPTGSRRSVPGSTAFVPACMGLMIAAHVVKVLCEA